MECKGRGDCIRQVGLNKYLSIACEYKCQLVECHNYTLCKKKLPLWVLDCQNGMCIDCAVMMGKIKFLDEKDDCPICLVNKDMIETECSHKVCIDCWKDWSEKSTQCPLTCPLCRTPIWK